MRKGTFELVVILGFILGCAYFVDQHRYSFAAFCGLAAIVSTIAVAAKEIIEAVNKRAG